MSARLDYLRDGQAIYARSFAMIRAEADLARFRGAAERVVVRMIHACGMTDLPADVEMSAGFAEAGEAALRAGAPILCDVRMVADGVTRARLPASNPVICTLGDPLADLATWLTYYTGRDEDGHPLIVGAGVPALQGFPPPQVVADRYAAATGRDVSNLAYYRAFSDFRLAVIAEGVNARYLAGQASGEGYDRAGASVPLLVDRALSHL